MRKKTLLILGAAIFCLAVIVLVCIGLFPRQDSMTFEPVPAEKTDTLFAAFSAEYPQYTPEAAYQYKDFLLVLGQEKATAVSPGKADIAALFEGPSGEYRSLAHKTQNVVNTPGLTAQVLYGPDFTVVFGSLGDSVAIFSQTGIDRIPFDRLNIRATFADRTEAEGSAAQNAKYILAVPGRKAVEDILFSAPGIEAAYSDYFDPLPMD